MGKIIIVGLGPGGRQDLTLAGFDKLKESDNIYLRTEKHPIVEYLREEGLKFKSFDYVYDNCGYNKFEEVYQHIAEAVLQEARKGDVLYAVPGHPLVAERAVQLIIEGCKSQGIEREIYPAMSFIDAIFASLEIDPIEGFKLIDGLDLDRQKPDSNINNIVTQVHSSLTASQAKLQLMNYYHDEQEIYLIRGAGVPGLEKVEKIPLYQLDRIGWIDYLTSIFIPRVEKGPKKYYNMNNLIEIMEILRSERGCPWDVKQTHKSLKPYLIEESNEVIETIDNEDDLGLEEELGDLLLQVVFHSQIAKERGAFQMEDVINGISKKLVFRHPHVFGDKSAKTEEDVAKIWAEQKVKEKEGKK